MKPRLRIALASMILAAGAWAQSSAPVAEVPITGAELKAIEAPKAESRLQGDPDGALTGTVADVAVSDPKKGLTIADVVNQVGQNRIAINFTWTLMAAFLVMFMQAGFAIVETGLCRAKNANHTMMMNFMVYGVGMLAFWLIGFPLQMGGVGAVGNLGGSPVLNSEFVVNLFGKPFGLFGQNGFFLMHAGAYDVSVMVVFLFQMVFMDTALTIVTGSAAERWKFSAFLISSFLMGAFIYPLFANWAWGGGWLATLGTNFGLGHGYVDFAGSGVVHSVGGLVGACAGHHHRASNRQVHPHRKAECDTRPRPGSGSDRLPHSGLRLVRLQSRLDAGRVRQRQPSHRLGGGQHHAGRNGGKLRRDALHVVSLWQARRLHVRQRAPGGLGGNHGALRIRQSRVGCASSA